MRLKLTLYWTLFVFGSLDHIHARNLLPATETTNPTVTTAPVPLAGPMVLPQPLTAGQNAMSSSSQLSSSATHSLSTSTSHLISSLSTLTSQLSSSLSTSTPQLSSSLSTSTSQLSSSLSTSTFQLSSSLSTSTSQLVSTAESTPVTHSSEKLKETQSTSANILSSSSQVTRETSSGDIDAFGISSFAPNSLLISSQETASPSEIPTSVSTDISSTSVSRSSSLPSRVSSPSSIFMSSLLSSSLSSAASDKVVLSTSDQLLSKSPSTDLISPFTANHVSFTLPSSATKSTFASVLNDDTYVSSTFGKIIPLTDQNIPRTEQTLSSTGEIVTSMTSESLPLFSNESLLSTDNGQLKSSSAAGFVLSEDISSSSASTSPSSSILPNTAYSPELSLSTSGRSIDINSLLTHTSSLNAVTSGLSNVEVGIPSLQSTLSPSGQLTASRNSETTFSQPETFKPIPSVTTSRFSTSHATRTFTIPRTPSSTAAVTFPVADRDSRGSQTQISPQELDVIIISEDSHDVLHGVSTVQTITDMPSTQLSDHTRGIKDGCLGPDCNTTGPGSEAQQWRTIGIATLSTTGLCLLLLLVGGVIFFKSYFKSRFPKMSSRVVPEGSDEHQANSEQGEPTTMKALSLEHGGVGEHPNNSSRLQ